MHESKNWIFSLNIYQLSGPLESFRDSFISRQVGFLPLGIDFLINVGSPYDLFFDGFIMFREKADNINNYSD